MCPDHQLLSVYLDSELPSPWKEQLETHLGGCPQCQDRIGQYRRVSAAIAAPPVPEEAISRVWRGILAEAEGNARGRGRRSFWNRTITIPLPAFAAFAAAVIMVFIMAFALIGASAGHKRQMDSTLASILPDLQEIVPDTDLEGVLQYLGKDQGSDIVIIQLPESKSFASFGRPMIIKAADYSRDN